MGSSRSLSILVARDARGHSTRNRCASAGVPNASNNPHLSLAAGGVNDTTSRVLAAELAKRLGRPVVIENRAGAAPRSALARPRGPRRTDTRWLQPDWPR